MGTDLQFDHAVHFVSKPEDLIAELAELGIHTVQGGRHEGIGTYNSLTYFDLSYIEWIGVFDHQLLPPHQETPRYGLVETLAEDGYTEGLSRIGVRTQRIDELAVHLANQGLEVVGPVDCSRRRPDGKLISWKLLFAGQPEGGLPLPFFIQWDESDETRRAELTQHGTIAEHGRGPLKLDYVAFTVHNLAKTVDNWTKWLGLEAEAPGYDDVWQGKKQTVRLGDVSLVFIEPDQNGTASTFLQKRGERPFALGLTGGAARAVQPYLNLHGSIYHLA